MSDRPRARRPWARTVLRTALVIVFVGGGVSHLVLGTVQPEGYAAFGTTSLLPGLSSLWSSFVMPNIRLLTIVLAALEMTAGIGLTLAGRAQQLAACGMCVFYAFLVVLGSGFPTDSFVEDVAKNRAPVILLALLTLPFLLWPDRLSLRRSLR